MQTKTRTTQDRLSNWGNFARQPHGPRGISAVSPMFQNAPTSQWHEDGWGDCSEAAPAEIPDPVDEADALIVDKLVCGLKSERLRIALLIEYATTPRSFDFRRYNYSESVDEAIKVMDDLLHGVSKKAQILRLLAENRHTETKIAEMVGVSKQYVCQLRAA